MLPFKKVESDFVMERNDCTVLALSQVTPLTYREAHDLLARCGRKYGHGFRLKLYLHHLSDHAGVRFEQVYTWISQLTGTMSGLCGPKSTKHFTVGQFVKMNLPGNYLVFVRGHVFAVIDGVVHDAARQGGRSPIRQIYKVELI